MDPAPAEPTDRPRESCSVRLLNDGPWRPQVTRLEVTTEAGSVTTAVVPDESEQFCRWSRARRRGSSCRFAAVDAADDRRPRTSGRSGCRASRSTSVSPSPDQLQDVFTDPSLPPPTYSFRGSVPTRTRLVPPPRRGARASPQWRPAPRHHRATVDTRSRPCRVAGPHRPDRQHRVSRVLPARRSGTCRATRRGI